MMLNYFLVLGLEFQSISFESWQEILNLVSAIVFATIWGLLTFGLLVLFGLFGKGWLSGFKDILSLSKNKNIVGIVLVLKWTVQRGLIAFFVSSSFLHAEYQSICIISTILVISALNTLIGKFVYQHWTYFAYELGIDFSTSLVFLLAHFEGLYFKVSFETVCISTTCLLGMFGALLFWT